MDNHTEERTNRQKNEIRGLALLIFTYGCTMPILYD